MPMTGKWIRKKGFNGDNRPPLYINKDWNTMDTETVTADDETAYISDWSIYDGSVIYRGGHVCDAVNTVAELASGGDINHRTVFYIHNLSYDWQYLKAFFRRAWGDPVDMLATKPHTIIYVVFRNGVYLRDSAVLAQSSLDKFCKEMGVTLKGIGEWDYDKRRVPGGYRTEDEIDYITRDVVGLWEGLNKLFIIFNTDHVNTAHTRTGYIRKEALKRAYQSRDHFKLFDRLKMTPDQYVCATYCYHGGNSHGNRFYIGDILENVRCFDYSSSYPARLAYEKFPADSWKKIDVTVDEILSLQENYAFMGYVIFTDLEVKKGCLNPPISRHKCMDIEGCGFADMDNGRVLRAEILAIAFSDPDLALYNRCYDWGHTEIVKCWYCRKDYLPQWVRDFLFELYKKKTMLKGLGDREDEYNKSKYSINGFYGMSVMKIVREHWTELYNTGDWYNDAPSAADQLESYYSRKSSFLPYQWGVWCTAYAQVALYDLMDCCGLWLYGDTDSAKGLQWDDAKIKALNDRVIEKANKVGIKGVEHNGKVYYMGLAEEEETYKEFVTLGSKRYCYRLDDGLHITVAGVPKEGAKELDNDIMNFCENMVFTKINKLRPEYVERNIYTINIDGIEIEAASASILHHVDYELGMTALFDEETGLPYNVDFDQDFD